MAEANGRSPEEYRLDLLFHLSRRLNRALCRPDWVSVNLTLRCNLRCAFCRTCHPSVELPTEVVLRIVDEAADWGVPIFNPLGGEPFLRSDIFTILERANARGLTTTVTTNGTLLDEEAARRLAPLTRVHVNFSIDGLEETHDRVRARGVFAKTTRAVRAVVEAERALFGGERSYRKLNMNTIIHKANLDEVAEMIPLARRLGIDKIQFLTLFDFERHGGTAYGEDLWVREEDWGRLDRAIDRLVELARGEAAGMIVNSPADLALVKLHYRRALPPHRAPCYNGLKEFYVDADGGGIMCDGRLNFDADRFGSVYRQGLREMWVGAEARRMRAKVRRCRFPCIQDCYLRRDSDRLWPIVRGWWAASRDAKGNGAAPMPAAGGADR